MRGEGVHQKILNEADSKVVDDGGGVNNTISVPNLNYFVFIISQGVKWHIKSFESLILFLFFMLSVSKVLVASYSSKI